MIQHLPSMYIVCCIYFLLVCRHWTNGSCQLRSSSSLSYQCHSSYPLDRTNVEHLDIICNSSDTRTIDIHERFYSIMQTYRTNHCKMKTFYLDRYTLWNYLQTMSINNAQLTRLSSVVFNRSHVTSPILYSIKSLNLSHNALRLLNKNFSYYFPSLEILDLSYNRLHQIRQRTLINFIHLKELYLNHNFLKHILPNRFPHQSLTIIDLHGNRWHCSCSNILTLVRSRTLTHCRTPLIYQHDHVHHIARQCLLYTQANIVVTTYREREENFTCTLTSAIDLWTDRVTSNYTFISAWHIEQYRSMSIDDLTESRTTYVICFDMNSTYPESIVFILNLSTSVNISDRLQSYAKPMNITRITLNDEVRLSPVLHWLFNISKIILPRKIRHSPRHVLIVWLILLTLATISFLCLIYYIYQQRHRIYHGPDHRTLLHFKFNCKNHKCLCHYGRRAHSKSQWTKDLASSKLHEQQRSPSMHRRPTLIEPSQLRYASIKRISSTKQVEQERFIGQFRTLVKLKSLPS
jgi:hypothetical protein